MKNKNAFTLLELLVVVLIIGILAAIALSKYQLVVDKSEFAKLQSTVASLRDAYDEYVMINGKGTNNFDNLSFTLPSDFVVSYQDYGLSQCRSNDNMFCCMSSYGDSWSALINCGKKNLSFIYSESLFGFNGVKVKRQGRCLAEENNDRANRLCESLGTKKGIGNNYTPSGYENRYLKYTLN